MVRSSITETVKTGRILSSDGAWGTLLQAAGLGPAECPELWNLDRPEAVRRVAEQYLAAGAEMVKTNSFGGSPFKLARYDLQDRSDEINRRAAALSREAAGDDHWVLGSVGPTGKMLVMGDVTEEELYAAFREQVVALEQGGADAVCVETMSDIDEARLAVQAAKENTRLEIIATFTFDRTVGGDYRTMMGVTPEDAAAAMLEAGADVVGTNCGNGLERMIEIVGRIRTALPETPILVHANAGMPVLEEGVSRYPDTPQFMASLVSALVDAGANVIGGCCGTTADHIQAIRSAIDELRAGR